MPLVLSRKVDESIIIRDPITWAEITVTVVDIRGDKVRLGIDAPAHISVHRAEVQRAIDLQAERDNEPCDDEPERPMPAEAACGYPEIHPPYAAD